MNFNLTLQVISYSQYLFLACTCIIVHHLYLVFKILQRLTAYLGHMILESPHSDVKNHAIVTSIFLNFDWSTHTPVSDIRRKFEELNHSQNLCEQNKNLNLILTSKGKELTPAACSFQPLSSLPFSWQQPVSS